MRYRLRTLLIVLALGATVQTAGRVAGELSTANRVAMAEKLAQVKVGDTPQAVELVAGKPDRRLKGDSDTTFEYADTKEVWYYGVAGTNEFPTLGRVYFGAREKGSADLVVTQVFGQAPVARRVTRLPEETVRSVLATMGRPNQCHSRYFDPGQIVAAVNRLQPLGKADAVAVIEEYLRVCPEAHGYTAEKVWMILLILFEPSPQHMTPALGRFEPNVSKELQSVPTFPLIVQSGIPLLMVWGYELIGTPPTVVPAVRFYSKRGTLRDAPLRPNARPWIAPDSFVDPKIGTPLTARLADRTRLRVQVLTLLAPLLPQVDLNHAKCLNQVELDGDTEWGRIVEKLKRVKFDWDEEEGSFAIEKE